MTLEVRVFFSTENFRGSFGQVVLVCFLDVGLL